MRAIWATAAALILAGAAHGQQKTVIPHGQTAPPGPALAPAEAIKKMVVPPGFSVELVVAEPDLVNPVAMHIDERGRFWITESLEYPKKAAGPGQDRVKVVEVGPDGKASKVTTVITGLNIPSGIAVGHGGVWVANAPDILYYPIEDFDRLKLGKPQVVVTGFGRFDTHELPNSFTWGPDGYLYGLNGVFNPSVVKQDGKEFRFTCALFRIHPVTRKFEIFCEGTSNPWGVAFNENGDAFVSACVIDHLWHLTETGYYHRQGGPYPPFTWKIGSIVKHKHQKAAYCGITWFDSDAYPEEFRKKLYMGNIHGNCINSDELTRDGSTYFGKPRPDLLTANDAWFMPVVQKTGPDGSLYILDWYDRYHCYQDANRDPKGIDRLHGRLYRLRYKDTPRAADFALDALDGTKLADELRSPNVFRRETAQRLLIERLLASKDPKRFDADKHNFFRLQQTNAGLGGTEATLRARAALAFAGEPVGASMERDDPILRAWGVRLRAGTPAPDRVDDVAADLVKLAEDPSADVKLQVAIAARKLPTAHAIRTLVEVLRNAGHDRLIPHIVWQNLHPMLEEQSGEFLKVVGSLDLEASPNVVSLMPRVVDRMLGAKKQDPAALIALVSLLSKQPATRESCAQVLATLTAKVASGELAGPKRAEYAKDLLPTVRRLQNGSNLALSLEATFLGAAFGDAESVVASRKVLGTPDQFEALRLKAVDALIAGGDAEVLSAALDAMAGPKASAKFRGALLASLGKADAPGVADAVLKRYASLEPEVQPQAIELLTQRAAWSKKLLSEIQAKKIPPTALNVNQVRKLLAQKDGELTKAVTSVWGTIREGRNPEREKVVADMREMLRKTPGDAKRGLPIYAKLCAQCHKLHGEGAEVGPDITSNGRSDFEQLLSNVFDPSLVIGAGYRSTTVVTAKGQVVNGLLVEDSPNRVVLKTQGGKIETFARADVEQATTSPLSYMPEGIERQLTSQEIADLFAILILDRPHTDPTARKIAGAP